MFKECVFRPLVKSAYQKLFFYFSTEAYVLGTQKMDLNETVLLNAQNMLKLMGKKYAQLYTQKFCLYKPGFYAYAISSEI